MMGINLMKKIKFIISSSNKQRGTVIVYVGIVIIVLLGFTALAVDLGHLYAAKNELQNAADAGALAGAQVLYLGNGTAVNPDANQTAHNIATANNSENVAVEVDMTIEDGQPKEIKRGHWSFANRTFAPNNSLLPVTLDRPTSVLDADPLFINAVWVKAKRQLTRIPLFFARIWGFFDFALEAEAIAYIGFAGKLEPDKLDKPIAICQQAIKDEITEEYSCNKGRMINSGSECASHNSAGWTNFSQSPCETANANSLKEIIDPNCCDCSSSPMLDYYEGIGTTGGEVEVAFDRFYNCWKQGKVALDPNNPDALTNIDSDEDGWPDYPWRLRLPVVDCPGNNVGNCSTLLGTVTIDVVWITRTDKNQFNEVPLKMNYWVSDDVNDPLIGHWEIWQCSGTGSACWDQFATQFNLKDCLSSTNPAGYLDKTIYFLPNCEPHEPTGVTGGKNFGVLARIPVLVN